MPRRDSPTPRDVALIAARRAKRKVDSVEDAVAVRVKCSAPFAHLAERPARFPFSLPARSLFIAPIASRDSAAVAPAGKSLKDYK